MRRPDENEPEKRPGHAEERLREFLDKRRPQHPPAPAPPTKGDADGGCSDDKGKGGNEHTDMNKPGP